MTGHKIKHWLMVQCCFTSTETVGLLGTGAQDGHLDFHTAPELWSLCVSLFGIALRPQKPSGLLWAGSPGRPLRLSHSSWAQCHWLIETLTANRRNFPFVKIVVWWMCIYLQSLRWYAWSEYKRASTLSAGYVRSQNNHWTNDGQLFSMTSRLLA